MSKQDSEQVKAVFLQAADLPQEQRGAFLDTACQGEPALRADVEALLEYDSSFETGQRDDTFLKSPLVVSPEGTMRVQGALASLDPVDREVLVLRHFQQLGRADTAQALGISQEDAAKRYFRALKKLRDILATLPGNSSQGG
jgi:DNA-directed RNA polymerase specialized sigma24 family protein